MVRSSARRLITIAVAVAAIPALTGCAAGLNAQTNQPYQTTDGTSVNFRDIAIRNMFVLGPDSGGTLQPGQSASLFLALVNNGSPDKLMAASAPGTASAVTIKGGTVNLTPGVSALLTGPAPELVLERLTRPLTGGGYVQVTLDFQNAGAVTLTVPVQARQSDYATFLPPPAASPSPSASGTRKGKKATPRPSGQSSTSATPSPSATP